MPRIVIAVSAAAAAGPEARGAGVPDVQLVLVPAAASGVKEETCCNVFDRLSGPTGFRLLPEPLRLRTSCASTT